MVAAKPANNNGASNNGKILFNIGREARKPPERCKAVSLGRTPEKRDNLMKALLGAGGARRRRECAATNMSLTEVILRFAVVAVLGVYLVFKHRQRLRGRLKDFGPERLESEGWTGHALDVAQLQPRLQRVR